MSACRFAKTTRRFAISSNAQFTEMKKSGELAKLQMKWFGATFETPDTLPADLP